MNDEINKESDELYSKIDMSLPEIHKNANLI